MPTDIKLKNSVTATNAPTSLQQGEVAINITDKKVWVGNAATTPVLLLGSGADGTFTNLTVSGVASFADGTVSLPSITNIGDTNTGIFFPAADTIAFTEGGVESMRIDASGNVGINTTNPDYGSFGASEKILGITGVATNRARLSFQNTATGTTGASGTIAFWNGTTQLAALDVIADGATNSGRYVFNTNNAGSFGERMRITSAGDVGIGTSSPSQKLSVFDGTNSTAYQMSIGASAAGSYNIGRNFANGLLTFYGTQTSFTGYVFTGIDGERMRIDSAGNVLVGTSGAIGKLGVVSPSSGYSFAMQGRSSDGQSIMSSMDRSGTVYTGNLTFPEDGSILFGRLNTGTNTERMRITSAGYVGIGTSSPSYRLDVADDRADYVGRFNQNSSTGNVLLLAANSSNTSSPFLVGFSSSIGGINVIIYTNGNIVNANNSYGSISDVKLKENIVDATPKLEDLCKVKVRQYNLKSDPNHKQIGVVAQELEEVFAGLVDETPDKDADGKNTGTFTKSVKYSVFVPMLIKAMQEQQALIENLTTRLNALEGK